MGVETRHGIADPRVSLPRLPHEPGGRSSLLNLQVPRCWTASLRDCGKCIPVTEKPPVYGAGDAE